MKKMKKFDVKKSLYPENSNYIAKLLDPYTARIAEFFYNLRFSANITTLITFILGMSSIVAIFIWDNYLGLIYSAILLSFRNIGDTIDGKIARGSDTVSSVGGFSDIITDWLFFHAAFFIAIGYLTNHIAIGFFCVTGYMSREFARRKFEKAYGKKTAETEEAEKISLIKSIVTKYDLGNVFWIAPLILLINKPVWIIYAVAGLEYSLLLAELGFDYYLLIKKDK